MSHFAEIDKNNKVLRVLVCDNNDPAGDEGYQWLLDNLGGTWIKTSYNNKIRFNFASIGYIYDEVADAFYEPKPDCGHSELFLDTTNYRWKCNNKDHIKSDGNN
jgi:hypothetical protein